MQAGGSVDGSTGKNGGYAPEAYRFIMDALTYTMSRNGERRHVTGRELACGARDLALDSWGLMARRVLESWGVTSTEDLGRIVFHMIKAGMMSKSPDDKIEDFKQVYGFRDAFDGARAPELDESGHAWRRLPQFKPGKENPWLNLIGDIGSY